MADRFPDFGGELTQQETERPYNKQDRKRFKKYGELLEKNHGFARIRDTYNSVDCIVYLLSMQSKTFTT